MIDTAEKRFAMLALGRRGFTLPVASGSFDAFGRMHLLGGYLQQAGPPPEAHGPFLWEGLGSFVPGLVAGGHYCPGLVAAQSAIGV